MFFVENDIIIQLQIQQKLPVNYLGEILINFEYLMLDIMERWQLQRNYV
jgi:hypothetical protein